MKHTFKTLLLFIVAVVCVSLNAEEQGRVHKTSLQIQAAQFIQQEIAQEMGLEHELFEVSMNNLMLMPPVDEKAESIELMEIYSLGMGGATRLDGLISLPSTVKINNEKIVEVTLTGALQVIGPVWVSKGRVVQGQTLSENDLLLTKMPWSRLPTGAFLMGKDQLVGKVLKRSAMRGSVLFPAILKEPYAVKRGEAVSLTIQSGPGVFIRSRAVATQSGGVGEMITIEQPQTRRKLRALVTGSKKVEVQL